MILQSTIDEALQYALLGERRGASKTPDALDIPALPSRMMALGTVPTSQRMDSRSKRTESGYETDQEGRGLAAKSSRDLPGDGGFHPAEPISAEAGFRGWQETRGAGAPWQSACIR